VSRVTAKKDLSRLSRQVKGYLKQIGVEGKERIANLGAKSLTEIARKDYLAGRNVYGEARVLGENGNALTLIKSGDTLRDLQFEAKGTRIRVVLGTPYAKYLVGKYRILPVGSGGELPTMWRGAIKIIVLRELAKGVDRMRGSL